MDLYLIRHAEAEPQSPDGSDERRGLTKKGRRRFESEVEGLARIGIRFDRLMFSPLLRAQDLPAGAPVQEWADRIHPDDRPFHRSMLIALFKGDIPRLDCEFRYCMPDGTVRWARQHGIVLRSADGRARRMIGATGDITESRQLQERLSDQARTDGLTRLPNRAVVLERLQRAIEHARRHAV